MASVAQIREEYHKKRWTAPATASSSKRELRLRVLEDQLASLKSENDDLNRAIYEAAQAQRKLCGPRYFGLDDYEFASEIFPVRHLSGDFISVMQIEGDVVFAIGDISGKGLLAGMWFTYMVGLIRREISAHDDPAGALTAVNRNLLASGAQAPLTTLILARLNAATGDLIYCNAGHPPALLIYEDGRLEELNEGGPVLGVLHGSDFVNGKAKLVSGSTLLAYSDGITECRNESGIEFGAERAASVIRRSARHSASSMLFSFLASVENFAGRRNRDDDIALMILRRSSKCEMNPPGRSEWQRHAA